MSNHASIVKLAYLVGVVFNDIRVSEEPEFPVEILTSSLDLHHPYRQKVVDNLNQHMRRHSREWQHVRLSTYMHRLGASEIIRVEHRTEGFTLLMRVTLDDNEQLVFDNMVVQRTTAMIPSEDVALSLTRGRSTFNCKLRRRTIVQEDPLWDSIAQVLNALIDTGWFTQRSLATFQAALMIMQTV